MSLANEYARCHPDRRARYYEKGTRRPICNSCYQKAHYFTNRWRYSAQQAGYYLKNAEARKAKATRWHWANRARSLRNKRIYQLRLKINGIRRKAA